VIPYQFTPPPPSPPKQAALTARNDIAQTLPIIGKLIGNTIEFWGESKWHTDNGKMDEFIAEIGNNKGCMELKGANRSHTGAPQPDRWGIVPDHEVAAKHWEINPDADLACTHKTAA